MPGGLRTARHCVFTGGACAANGRAAPASCGSGGAGGRILSDALRAPDSPFCRCATSSPGRGKSFLSGGSFWWGRQSFRSPPSPLPLGGAAAAAAEGLQMENREKSATATTAASGGCREELLGQRSAGHECRSRHEVDAGHRNPSERSGWIFSGSTSSLGSERGEQPLSRGSSASKSLVVFWFSFATKREQTPAAMHFAKGINPAPRDHALRGKQESTQRSVFARLRQAENFTGSTAANAGCRNP